MASPETPYHSQVSADITELSKRSICSFPFSEGVYWLKAQLGRMPLWGQSFAEREERFIPDTEDKFEIEIERPIGFAASSSPNGYERIRIEREYFLEDPNREAVVVERIYSLVEGVEIPKPLFVTTVFKKGGLYEFCAQAAKDRETPVKEMLIFGSGLKRQILGVRELMGLQEPILDASYIGERL